MKRTLCAFLALSLLPLAGCATAPAPAAIAPPVTPLAGAPCDPPLVVPASIIARVRAQFSSETNVRLMQESLRICREFADEMKINRRK